MEFLVQLRKGLMKLSNELAQDSRTWGASISNVENPIGDVRLMLSKVQRSETKAVRSN